MTDLLPLPEIERRLRVVRRRLVYRACGPECGAIGIESLDIDYPALAREVARMLEEQREAAATDPTRDLKMWGVYAEVKAERVRQVLLKAAGKFRHTPSDVDMDEGDKLAALMEEVGEASEALLERRGLIGKPKGTDLRKELIQVAAIAIGWIEALDAAAIRSQR